MYPDTTLFISIASYRDPELIATLHDLIAQAHYPQRLRIAICWQDDLKLDPFFAAGMVLENTENHQGVILYTLIWQGVRVRLLALHYLKSQGACWARHLAETLYDEEHYFLQIDSHCRFIPHWDSEMIAMLESLRSKSPRPVLSSYPPAYTPGKDEKRASKVNRLFFKGINKRRLVYFAPCSFEAEQPQRCGFLAAGFLFAEGHFVKNVRNDPQIFFMGEEIAMAARAWTYGYDIWSPHKVLLWHYYSRKIHPKVWQDHNTEAQKEGVVDLTWWQRDAIAQKRIHTLLGFCDDPVDLGIYGLGQQRSLREFQYRIGIDFTSGKVHPDVYGPQRVTWFDTLPATHQKWLQTLDHIHQRHWHLEKGKIDINQNDVSWWHLGVYTADNQPLFIQQLSPEEFQKKLKPINEEITELKILFKTAFPAPAHSMRLCHYSLDTGWGEVMEQSW